MAVDLPATRPPVACRHGHRRDRGPRRRPPRRPQPPREAQRVQRGARARHRRGAARRRRRPRRALRRAARRGPDVLVGHGPRRARRAWPSSRDMLRPFRRACLEAWNLAEEMAKPTVCQIHGACIGGALELALACDLRVIAADALVGLPETRIGLIPDVGGSSRLPQVVGLGRAKELIMTGKLIGGDGGRADRARQPRRARGRARGGDAGARRRAARLRAGRGRAGQARDRRLRPPRARRDARARGRDAGAVRALGGLRGGRDRVPREAPAAVQRAADRSPVVADEHRLGGQRDAEALAHAAGDLARQRHQLRGASRRRG